MSTITMQTVRANLIAKGMLTAAANTIIKAHHDTGRASNLKAVAARKQELGYWPTIVYKARKRVPECNKGTIINL